jgi:hypothetical protein
VYKGTAAGNEVFFTQISSSTTTFTGQHLTPLTQFAWFVRAEVAELDSGPSNDAVATTPDVPAAPANFRVTNKTSTAVALAWDASPNALEYQIHMSTNGGTTFTFKTAVLASVTSVVIGNLAPGTYQFEVLVEDVARNTGHLSAPVSVTLP